MRPAVRAICFVLFCVCSMQLALFTYGLQLGRANVPRPSSPQGSHLSGMSPASKIPKIIHRMYKNDSIPDKWKGCQQSCIDQHPGWQHNLWTDDSMLQFMRAFYPADVDNYLRYPYDIQRADAFRYFVLDFFGGVYIDMDIECKKPLDPLLNHTLYLPRTEPFGFSNDFLMAQPHHPLLQQLQRSLPHWNLYFGFPFLTVFLSTGPLFLGFQYTLNPGLQKMVSVMPLELYNGRDPKKSYLDHWDGNSWHKWDAVYIAWAWDAVRIGTREYGPLVFFCGGFVLGVYALSALLRRLGPRVGLLY